MFSRFLSWIKSFFKPKYDPNLPYIIVEAKTDDGGFRQGIRILPEQVVVLVSPKVKVEVVNDALEVTFDFSIVADPKGTNLTKEDLKTRVGDAIIDIMNKDYASVVQD